MSGAHMVQLAWIEPTPTTMPDADTSVLLWVGYPDGTSDWCSGWLDADGWHDCASGGLVGGVVIAWADVDGPGEGRAVPSTQRLTDAARDVLAERRRQIEVEGWTPEHDDRHRTGAMAIAAACYAIWLPNRPASEIVATLWPWTGWASKWFKPKDTRHNLVRATALLLAEIELRDRAAIRQSTAGPTTQDTPT